MTDWKEQIEAQIADLRRYSYQSDDPTDEVRQLIDSMHNAATQLEALLDVAVGFETDVEEGLYYMYPETYKALRKLREVGDE